MTATQQQYYSIEEYLQLEEAADYKSEYIDGQIIHKAGGTTNHNQEYILIAQTRIYVEQFYKTGKNAGHFMNMIQKMKRLLSIQSIRKLLYLIFIIKLDLKPLKHRYLKANPF